MRSAAIRSASSSPGSRRLARSRSVPDGILRKAIQVEQEGFSVGHSGRVATG